MPAYPSGAQNLDEAGSRHRRLADLLADMVPGAATFRVTLLSPAGVWPHPHARAYDAAGAPVTLTRTQETTAARWIIRIHPEADWTRPHAFDLATAQLTRSDKAVAGRGR
jgi:hypothetical protein